MKKFTIRLYLRSLLIGLTLCILFSGTVLAVNSTMPNSVSIGPLTEPEDPQKSTTLEERLTKRKAALKVQVSTSRKQAIVDKCSAAQNKLKDLKTKNEAAADKRNDKYNMLATELANIIAGLEAQDMDVDQLKNTQNKFNTALNQYLLNAINFKAALSDIVVMDCKNDPVGFEATLLSARQLKAQLAKDTKSIKETVPELLKALDISKQELVMHNSQIESGEHNQ